MAGFLLPARAQSGGNGSGNTTGKFILGLGGGRRGKSFTQSKWTQPIRSAWSKEMEQSKQFTYAPPRQLSAEYTCPPPPSRAVPTSTPLVSSAVAMSSSSSLSLSAFQPPIPTPSAAATDAIAVTTTVKEDNDIESDKTKRDNDLQRLLQELEEQGKQAKLEMQAKLEIGGRQADWSNQERFYRETSLHDSSMTQLDRWIQMAIFARKRIRKMQAKNHVCITWGNIGVGKTRAIQAIFKRYPKVALCHLDKKLDMDRIVANPSSSTRWRSSVTNLLEQHSYDLIVVVHAEEVYPLARFVMDYMDVANRFCVPVLMIFSEYPRANKLYSQQRPQQKQQQQQQKDQDDDSDKLNLDTRILHECRIPFYSYQRSGDMVNKPSVRHRLLTSLVCDYYHHHHRSKQTKIDEEEDQSKERNSRDESDVRDVIATQHGKEWCDDARGDLRQLAIAMQYEWPPHGVVRRRTKDKVDIKNTRNKNIDMADDTSDNDDNDDTVDDNDDDEEEDDDDEEDKDNVNHDNPDHETDRPIRWSHHISPRDLATQALQHMTTWSQVEKSVASLSTRSSSSSCPPMSPELAECMTIGLPLFLHASLKQQQLYHNYRNINVSSSSASTWFRDCEQETMDMCANMSDHYSTSTVLDPLDVLYGDSVNSVSADSSHELRGATLLEPRLINATPLEPGLNSVATTSKPDSIPVPASMTLSLNVSQGVIDRIQEEYISAIKQQAFRDQWPLMHQRHRHAAYMKDWRPCGPRSAWLDWLILSKVKMGGGGDGDGDGEKGRLEGGQKADKYMDLPSTFS